MDIFSSIKIVKTLGRYYLDSRVSINVVIINQNNNCNLFLTQIKKDFNKN